MNNFRTHFLLVLTLFCLHSFSFSQVGNFTSLTIKGKVFDSETGEPLVGVNIYISNLDKYVASDVNGEFELEPSLEVIRITLTYIGYEEKSVNIKSNKTKVTVRLRESLTELNEVVISSERADNNVSSTNLGRDVMQLETIKDLPPLAGEIDVIKSMVLLPGVSTVGEASAGFNVRGGGLDQNLFLLGGGVLYNPSHLFGFFSSINAEVINNVTLYKGVVPSQYGGRVSSVVDIEYKPSNYKNWGGNVGIGMASSKLGFSGPIIKDRLAVSFAGRASYVDWLLSAVDNAEIRISSAVFYVLNGRIDYRINDNNNLSYSIYQSVDEFNLASDTVNQWTNFSQVLKWQHSSGDKFAYEVLVAESIYDFALLNETGVNDFDLTSDIIDRSAKADFTFTPNEKNTINVGAEVRLTEINPGDFELKESEFNEREVFNVESEQSREYSVFFYNTHELTKRLNVSYGLRVNRYQYLGDKTINQYEELFPRNTQNIIGSTEFGEGEVISEYDRFAPRLGVRYSLNPTLSIKAGVNRMFQFIQLVSNTATLSPVNVWKLSDSFIKPQEVLQYSFGVFKNFKNDTYETSIEGYYKDIDNVLEYKDGAELLLNENLETELLNGEGRAYGVELYFKKKTGRWTGWASYTYSRSERLVEGAFPSTTVNNGEWYASNFDKPHDFTFVVNRKIRRYASFSAVFTYNTGRPVTYPTDKLNYFGQDIAYFDSRNESRIPDYHRLDLSITWKFPTNKKLLNGDWTFGIYNVYGRQNAFSVFFDDIPGRAPGAFKLSILNSPVPSLSYNVSF